MEYKLPKSDILNVNILTTLGTFRYIVLNEVARSILDQDEHPTSENILFTDVDEDVFKIRKKSIVSIVIREEKNDDT